ncbi:MAG: elongation factor 1-beta [Candidatus Hydrothermarchaeaceae archaeon]
MAEVLVTMKIMPKSAGEDMDALEARIGKIDNGKLNKVKKEPIAFGLVALIASYVIEDKEGGTEKLEAALNTIEEIGNIEILEVTRLL